MKKVMMLGVLLPIFSLHAEEVIDLGGLEVQGELRQPPVRFYQPEKVAKEVMKETAEKHFEDFEKELLVANADKEQPQKNKERK